jgi:hypothetical protein
MRQPWPAGQIIASPGTGLFVYSTIEQLKPLVTFAFLVFYMSYSFY